MCGIAGVLSRKEIIDFSCIDTMLNRIYHRGPDDRGLCGITLEHKLVSGASCSELPNTLLRGVVGFNRLSIRDLSANGHQPMFSADGLVSIVFNGEIYNIDSIKESELKGVKFNSSSDTEVILNLYLKYDFDKAVKMLNGMFAIIIIDSRKRKIYIARDRYGIIPFHYIFNEHYFAFASEIKAFMDLPCFLPKLSNYALDEYLYNSYPNVCLYEGVESLEAGQVLTYDYESSDISFNYFFDVNDFGKSDEYCKISLEEAETKCLRLLKDATKNQLVSDVPVGLQLSGGVDSSIIAALGISVQRGLEAFSIVNDNSLYSEEKYIDYAAGKYNILTHKVNMSVGMFLKNFEKSLYAFERFVNLPSPVGIYGFAENASRSVKVLLSGEGADEIAGGYDIFKKVLRKSFSRTFNRYLPFGRGFRPLDDGVKNTFENFLAISNCRTSVRVCKNLKADFNIENILLSRKDYIQNLEGNNFTKLRKYMLRYELPGLLERQNKICMAHSVENRVPFLDNNLVDFLFSIPEEYLMYSQEKNKNIFKNIRDKDLEGKYILKCVCEKLYNTEFAYRIKMAMRMPLAEYLRSDLMQKYIREIVCPAAKQRGLLSNSEFEDKYTKILLGCNEQMAVDFVWSFINVEIWCQLFLDQRKPMEYL